MRWALGIEYCGSDFCGWQSQPNRATVQDCLELAISRIAGHEIRLHAAGRTDTGVHALMQVVHFDTESLRPEQAWVRGVNAFLPSSVRVIWSKCVSEDFHARFSAQGRSYQYWLINRPYSSAVLHGRVGWYHKPLSLEPMQEAMRYLLGEHDFSAFRASECQAKTPIKTLYVAEVEQNQQMFVFRFSANAFLHHQVRNMVGALIYIGNGTFSPSHVKTLLDSKDRRQSPPTFSPDGLYLTDVKYDARWGLPESQILFPFINSPL